MNFLLCVSYARVDTVTGWGTLYSNGYQPNILQAVNVT